MRQEPTWLAPEQARVFALSSGEIALARHAAVPYLLCVGAREAAVRTVSVPHAEQREELGLARAGSQISAGCARRSVPGLGIRACRRVAVHKKSGVQAASTDGALTLDTLYADGVRQRTLNTV